MNKIKFEELAIDFLEQLFASMESSQIVLSPQWDIDHLCYRVDSLARYEELKKSFATFGKLLIESDVNGRPIATFKLNSRLSFKGWEIDVVELPAPKPSKQVKEGFEHIEIVCDSSFDDLEVQYKHIKLDKNGLKKDFNQELELDLGERNLKFHHMSLESVIRVEENKPVFNALLKSQVLSLFKAHTPIVAGTFPLGIFTPESDLDILMEASDLHELEAKLKSTYENFSDFQSVRTFVDDLETLIVKFKCEGIAFEVFAQNRSVVKQKAFLHFQIEERLLKLADPTFLKSIKDLRAKGFKTEPAFGEVLNIDTDPFLELLNFQKLSTAELKTKLESV